MPPDDPHGSVPDEREIEAGNRYEAVYRAVLDHLPAAELSPEGHRQRARRIGEAVIEALSRVSPSPEPCRHEWSPFNHPYCARCGTHRDDVSPSPERDTVRLRMYEAALRRISEQRPEMRPGDGWTHWRAIATEALAEFPDAPAHDARRDTVAVEGVLEAARALRWNVTNPYSDDTDVLVEGESWRKFQRLLFSRTPTGDQAPKADEP